MVDTDDRKGRNLLRVLKTLLVRDFGRKCKEFTAGCIICQCWQAFEVLKSAYFFEKKVGKIK